MSQAAKPRSGGRSATGSVGYQTRALERALAILDAFTIDQPDLSVKDLHEKLGLPKPTISRLASMLELKGYLRRNAYGFELGPKTFELGSMYVRQRRALAICRPVISRLAEETEQTACLAEIAGSSVIHLIVGRSPSPVQYVTEIGSRAPAHATALGKALLATMDAEEVETLVGEDPLARHTPNTIRTCEALFEELETIRKRGYALDDEEFASGLRCIAIALDLEHLGMTAISVSGASATFSKTVQRQHVKALRNAALELRHVLSDGGAEVAVPVSGVNPLLER